MAQLSLWNRTDHGSLVVLCCAVLCCAVFRKNIRSTIILHWNHIILIVNNKFLAS